MRKFRKLWYLIAAVGGSGLCIAKMNNDPPRDLAPMAGPERTQVMEVRQPQPSMAPSSEYPPWVGSRMPVPPVTESNLSTSLADEPQRPPGWADAQTPLNFNPVPPARSSHSPSRARPSHTREASGEVRRQPAKDAGSATRTANWQAKAFDSAR